MEGLRRRAPFVQAVSVNGDSLDFPCPLPAHRAPLLPSIEPSRKAKLTSFTAPKEVLDDLPVADFQDEEGVEQFGASKRIVDRESDYSKRRLNRSVAGDASTYAERVKEAQLEREKDNTMKQIAQKRREEAERAAADARLAAARGDDAEKDALPSAPSEPAPGARV